MSKKIIKFGACILIIFNILLINSVSVFAQQYKEPPKQEEQQDKTTEPIEQPPEIPKISTLPGPPEGDVSGVSGFLQNTFLPRIAITIVSLAVGASVFFLIFGAVQMLTAYGMEEKLTNAKKTVMFALIGLVISLLSYAIVQLIFYSGYLIGQV